MNTNDFEKACDSEFMFLIEDFGFVKSGRFVTNALQIDAYTSESVALTIEYERLDQYLAVNLGPKSPGDRGIDPLLCQEYKLSLQSIISIRSPGMLLFPPGLTGRQLADSEISAILTRFASTLKAHCADILNGDFSITPEVRAYLISIN